MSNPQMSADKDMSEFDLFMSQFPSGQKPPREELMKLAAKLCEEANAGGSVQKKPPPTNDALLRRKTPGTAQKISNVAITGTRKKQKITREANLPSDTDSVTDMDATGMEDPTTICRVSWDGISPKWFQRVFVNTPEIQRFIEYGCRMWFLREFGILEILRRRGGISSGPAIDYLSWFDDPTKDTLNTDNEVPVSKATAFISFTGLYTVKHFTNLLRHDDLIGKYVWVDTFCVDQFAWTSPRKTPAMTVFKKHFIYKLAEKISKIRYTALMLNRWDNLMMTINQIWVLLEIFVTTDSKATLRFLFTQEEHEHFQKYGIENAHGSGWTLGRSLADIDVRKALVELEEDKKMILEYMEERGGAHLVNRQVCKQLNEWVTQTANLYLEQLKMQGEVATHVLGNIANLLAEQGNCMEAEQLYWDVLERCRASLGDQHPETLKSINSLAGLLADQGNFKEAEQLYEEALEGCKATLGDHHPDTLLSINDQANLLAYQGSYKEAEQLYRKVLEGRRTVLGDNHPDTLLSINNLANLLAYQGNYKEAEQLYRKALKGRGTVLGDHHPDTLHSINNLANLLVDQGNYNEAEQLYGEALEGFRATLGDHHPDTLSSMNNLAILLAAQGNSRNAEQHYRESLEGFRASLGDNHPNTLQSINNLANLLVDQGNYKEAEKLYGEALGGRKATLGDHHPDTLSTINNLANLLAYQGSYKEAEQLYRKALEGRRTVLGDHHPDILHSINNLANLLAYQGNYKEAEQLYGEAKIISQTSTRKSRVDSHNKNDIKYL